jgi:hypothetical protein
LVQPLLGAQTLDSAGFSQSSSAQMSGLLSLQS